MGELQVIKKVKETTKWVSSIVAVDKAGWDEIRICLDPKDVNKAIWRKHFQLPRVKEITSKLSNTLMPKSLQEHILRSQYATSIEFSGSCRLVPSGRIWICRLFLLIFLPVYLTIEIRLTEQ